MFNLKTLAVEATSDGCGRSTTLLQKTDLNSILDAIYLLIAQKETN